MQNDNEPTLPPPEVDRGAVDRFLADVAAGMNERDLWDRSAVLLAILSVDGEMKMSPVMELPMHGPSRLEEMVDSGMVFPETAPGNGDPVVGLAVIDEGWATTIKPNDRLNSPIVDLPESMRVEMRMLTVAFRNGSTGSLVHERGKEPGTKVEYVPRALARDSRVPGLLFRLLTGTPL